MRGTMLLGVILLIAGLAGLAWPVITYTTTEKVVDIGPVEVTAEREKRRAGAAHRRRSRGHRGRRHHRRRQPQAVTRRMRAAGH